VDEARRCIMTWQIQSPSAGVVIMTFDGRLSAEDGRGSATAFIERCKAERIDIVWDVSNMRGYDSEARRAWQDALLPHRHRFRTITVIGGTALVRMGASAVALMLGMTCGFVKTRAEYDRMQARRRPT